MIVNVNNGTNNKSKTSEFSYGATFQFAPIRTNEEREELSSGIQP